MDQSLTLSLQGGTQDKILLLNVSTLEGNFKKLLFLGWKLSAWFATTTKLNAHPHPSSDVTSPQHSVSSLFLTNDLSVHASIFNKFPHFFPIILSLFLSHLHCEVVTPQEREVEKETVWERGKREKKRRERAAEGKVSISQQTNRLTLRR